MSRELAMVFIKRMQLDIPFCESILSITDVDTRLKAMAAAGYDCTQQDLLKFMQDCQAALRKTLHPQSGGICEPNTPPDCPHLCGIYDPFKTCNVHECSGYVWMPC